jgi:hypothetical protein
LKSFSRSAKSEPKRKVRHTYDFIMRRCLSEDTWLDSFSLFSCHFLLLQSLTFSLVSFSYFQKLTFASIKKHCFQPLFDLNTTESASVEVFLDPVLLLRAHRCTAHTTSFFKSRCQSFLASSMQDYIQPNFSSTMCILLPIQDDMQAQNVRQLSRTTISAAD